MTITRNLLVMLVVFTIGQCDSTNDGPSETGCPCLPIEICPRVLGSEPQDHEFTLIFSDCVKPYVRCCGVSSSYIYGKKIDNSNIEIPLTTEIDFTTIVTENPSTEEFQDVITVLPESIKLINKNKLKRIKMENNISIIYPSEMSGIIQTTPENMSSDNGLMVKSIDEDGVEMMLIFPNLKTSEIIETTTNGNNNDSKITTTIKQKKIIKKRRKYNSIKIKNKTKPNLAEISTFKNEKNLTTIKEDNGTKAKLSEFYKTRRMPMRKFPSTENESEIKTEKPKPNIREEDYEHNRIGRAKLNPPKSRKILYNPSTRTNFLRRNPITVTTTTTTTMESDLETEIVTTTTPSSINFGLQSRIDTEHRIMIEHVHTALKTKTTKGESETARSIMDPAINSRVIKIEKILANKMTDMVNKMIGIKTDLFSDITNDSKKNIKTTKRPYRGSKRYMVPTWFETDDLPIEITPKSRLRSSSVTTEAPIIATTVRNIFRRPLTRRPLQRKFQSLYKATPSKTIEEIMTSSTTTTTVKPTTEKIEVETIESETDSTTDNPVTELIEESIEPIISPRNNFSNHTSTLFANFKPSPLWTLNSGETISAPINIRQSRGAFKPPTETYEGFVPVIHNGSPLSIVGDIPTGFFKQKSATTNFGLPTENKQKFN